MYCSAPHSVFLSLSDKVFLRVFFAMNSVFSFAREKSSLQWSNRAYCTPATNRAREFWISTSWEAEDLPCETLTQFWTANWKTDSVLPSLTHHPNFSCLFLCSHYFDDRSNDENIWNPSYGRPRKDYFSKQQCAIFIHCFEQLLTPVHFPSKSETSLRIDEQPLHANVPRKNITLLSWRRDRSDAEYSYGCVGPYRSVSPALRLPDCRMTYRYLLLSNMPVKRSSKHLPY